MKIVRELQGVIKSFGAEHGLVIAWGGYRGSVAKEAARSYFELRLWNSTDLVQNILENYDRLPDAIQASLPLKRVWTLAVGED